MEHLDWSKCPLVEIDPLRVSGRPVVKGTRMAVEDIIANYEYGVSISEISSQFQIPATIIKELLSYVERRTRLRVLFDKNVPYGARHFLPNHQVETVDDHGWSRISNGELLKTAEAAGFEVVLTADQNILYQQTLVGRKIALVVLGSNILANCAQPQSNDQRASGRSISRELCVHRNVASTQKIRPMNILTRFHQFLCP